MTAHLVNRGQGPRVAQGPVLNAACPHPDQRAGPGDGGRERGHRRRRVRQPLRRTGYGAMDIEKMLGDNAADVTRVYGHGRSEEHTSELQSLMRISYAVFCLKKKRQNKEPTYSLL